QTLYVQLHISVLSACSLKATSTPDIDSLSLHDALPISAKLFVLNCELTATAPSWESCNVMRALLPERLTAPEARTNRPVDTPLRDRKSTRLNSSHQIISYAVFCLKKKNITADTPS